MPGNGELWDLARGLCGTKKQCLTNTVGQAIHSQSFVISSDATILVMLNTNSSPETRILNYITHLFDSEGN